MMAFCCVCADYIDSGFVHGREIVCPSCYNDCLAIIIGIRGIRDCFVTRFVREVVL